MSQQRSISRVVNVPPAAPGFVGPGHLAAPVVSPENFEMNDPFILLMDDHLDIGDRPVGGPHPHAGFETVTLILDGAIFDRDEGGTLNAGEVQMIGDRAYDSDRLDRDLAERYGIEMIAPHRGVRRKPTQDERPLRRYCRRWRVERLFAWLHHFRRLVIRWEYHVENFLGMVRLGCMQILLRYV